MRQYKKNFILIIVIMGIILLAGCNKFNFHTFTNSEDSSDIQTTIAPKDQNSTDINNKTEDTQANSENITPSSEDILQSENATPTSTSIQPTSNIDLQVYTVDSDLGEIEPVTAAVPAGSEITPQLIVDTVVESLADQSINIVVKDVTTKDDIVIVNFDKDNTPYKNLGSDYEGAILDAIAQSLIDDLKDYKKVIFRVDGGAYVGGAFETGIDEYYLEDNN